MLNFPNSPAIDDRYYIGSPVNKHYQWIGQFWKSVPLEIAENITDLKAWMRFAPTSSMAVRSSHGCTVVKLSAGHYRITFTTRQTTPDYTVIVHNKAINTTHGYTFVDNALDFAKNAISSKTTRYFDIKIIRRTNGLTGSWDSNLITTYNTTYYDPPEVSFVVYSSL